MSFWWIGICESNEDQAQPKIVCKHLFGTQTRPGRAPKQIHDMQAFGARSSLSFALDRFFSTSSPSGCECPFGGLAFVFIGVIKAARQNTVRQKRILNNCTLVVFLSWFIHSGLTFPFYSKYSALPMALILGTMLVLLGQPVDDQGSG